MVDCGLSYDCQLLSVLSLVYWPNTITAESGIRSHLSTQTKEYKIMSNKYHDVLVGREYESQQNGAAETKTFWSKVGRAWPTRSGEALNLELFLIPNSRYFIQLKNNQKESPANEIKL